MNVVAYCRYSSENQRDGYSIEAQKKAISDYCNRMNYTILRFYIDEAIIPYFCRKSMTNSK